MTSVNLTVRACVEVQIGMRVYYDCPRTSSDYASAGFFRTHKGKYATVVGFPTEYVGPLDRKGRMPGEYYRAGAISVRFDDEDAVCPSLNLAHFVLVSPALFVQPGTSPRHQRAGDLPEPIAFYPGDAVYRRDDAEHAPRVVEDVLVNTKGEVRYVLDESDSCRDIRLRREAEEEMALERTMRKDSYARYKARSSSMPDTEVCTAEQLGLIAPRNVHLLYADPSHMMFETPEAEVCFWAHAGLSHPVVNGDISQNIHGQSLADARAQLDAGTGDLIVRSVFDRRHRSADSQVERGEVRRLHACFDAHRERVRTLALMLDTVPDEPQMTSAQLIRFIANSK